jgi:putative CocE/NonD family hydrolase
MFMRNTRNTADPKEFQGDAPTAESFRTAASTAQPKEPACSFSRSGAQRPLRFHMYLRLALIAGVLTAALCRADVNVIKATYDKFEFRVPMRDGVKLFTIVYAPKDQSEKYPFLITRTPYNVSPYGPDAFPEHLGPSEKFGSDKFIFVMQDVRGRFESEGDFVDVPIIKETLDGPADTDETTDSFDTIDWLLKNVPNNNGKVGIYGISYNGFYTSCALIRSHPALVAASPQAPMADLFMGDDAYHNGSFFLMANFSFYTSFPKQNNPTLPENHMGFPYGTKDGYQFYLQMGSVSDSDKKYLFKNHYWTDNYTHTTYDGFWRPRDILPHLNSVKPAVLVVGGWFDAEDLSGTLKTYRAIERTSPGTALRIVMGPWFHGGWRHNKGDKLGDIPFDAPTAEYFRDEIEFPFFRHYLKGEPEITLAKAVMFETGKNVWKSSAEWPPKNAAPARLYLHAEGNLNFRAPMEPQAADTYDSDSNHPVPFYAKPTLVVPHDYMDADQRFLTGRKDVLTYVTDPLPDDLTIAGPISPTLFVSTTGTDSDFIVKLIDQLPDGYQELVRGEPFRGKFRNSFQDPIPFIPGVMQQIHFVMPDAYHCFLKGHRIMVQIQSSWFPLVDRNPQTFTDIPTATPEQFITATESIFRSRLAASYVELNLVH